MSGDKSLSNGARRNVVHPKDCIVILFGVTGDLAKRKLLPGLFHLSEASLMPDKYHIIGCAPEGTGTDQAGFGDYVRNILANFARKEVTEESWIPFANRLSFVPATRGILDNLAEEVTRIEAEMNEPTRIIYLAVPPAAFTETIQLLASGGLVNDATRLVIEKPFGSDLRSARKLNAELHRVFKESQIYRIDHFLGKESVQNILAFRFANGLFEAAWNNTYIDYVQIDVPETLTIGSRAAFYEATGAFRDMVVTHLFQILGFLAMEPPSRLSAHELHGRKIEVYRAVRPIEVAKVIYGQYLGYKQESGVAPDSNVETFVALEVAIENERWSGVRWYLRTGKSMANTRTSVTIGFKESPLHMFQTDTSFQPRIRPNELTFELTDPGSVTVHLLVKKPGPVSNLEVASLSFQYDESTLAAMELEAYERLFHDVMLDEHLLFNRADAIERLWEISEPLLNAPPLPINYPKGSWGPSEAERLISPFSWHLSRDLEILNE